MNEILKIKLIFLIMFGFNSFIYCQIDFDDYQKSLQLYDEASSDIENGNFEAATEKLIAAISIDSLNRGSYINLYRACFNIKEYDLILPYLEQAKQIFLEDDELFYYTGNIYQNLGNLDQAIMNYDSAAIYSKINGEDYPIVYAYYLNRGICFIKKGNYDLALEDFSYSIQLNKNDGIVYFNRGTVFYKLDKFENACSDWNTAYKLGIEAAEDYFKKYCQ
jgi:tetratricopeptide (TPR) repeat protein